VKLRVGDLKRILVEAQRGQLTTYHRILLTEEGDSAAHTEGGSGESLDNQVDKYLMQYENDSKKTDGEVPGGTVGQMESADWRDICRGILNEAGDDDAADKPAKPDPDADGTEDAGAPAKLGVDSLDVEKFASNVVRLIENYDSLLEVRNTLMRRAKAFLAKTYDDEVCKTYDDVLRDDHGMEPGANKGELNADKYPAPAADRASGSAEAGPGGGGAP